MPYPFWLPSSLLELFCSCFCELWANLGRVDTHSVPSSTTYTTGLRGEEVHIGVASFFYSIKGDFCCFFGLGFFISSLDFSFVNHIWTQLGIQILSPALTDLGWLMSCHGSAPPCILFLASACYQPSSLHPRLCCLVHAWHSLNLSQLITKIRSNSQPLREKQMEMSCPFSRERHLLLPGQIQQQSTNKNIFFFPQEMKTLKICSP